MNKTAQKTEGFSLINGKRWKYWIGKIIAVDEKVAHSFTDEDRKLLRALDSALKNGLVRTTDKIMLIVVAGLEKAQVILDWKQKLFEGIGGTSSTHLDNF